MNTVPIAQLGLLYLYSTFYNNLLFPVVYSLQDYKGELHQRVCVCVFPVWE